MKMKYDKEDAKNTLRGRGLKLINWDVYKTYCKQDVTITLIGLAFISLVMFLIGLLCYATGWTDAYTFLGLI